MEWMGEGRGIGKRFRIQDHDKSLQQAGTVLPSPPPLAEKITGKLRTIRKIPVVQQEDDIFGSSQSPPVSSRIGQDANHC